MFTPQGFDFDADLHLFRHEGINILLDVNSGAISILDDLGYRFIQTLQDYNGDIHRALDRLADDYVPEELSALLKEMEDTYAAGAIFTRPEALVVDWSDLPIKALCLHVAHACNMKCHYCFASQGDFGLKPRLMSLATAKRALDFLVARSGSVKNLEVDFFGGEPLLNWQVVTQIVRYGRQMEPFTGKRFNFTLTTNAVLLDGGIMDFIIENDISIILSLDGRCSTNDQHRIMSNGEGSYSIILPKIQQMVARKPLSYYIRGTFTKHNLDFSRDLQHLVELGFDNVSLEPAIGPANPYTIQDSDLPAVLAEYDRLTDLLYTMHRGGRDISFFHYNLDLQKGPCLAKRLSGCGAGVEYLAITPEGDIYPCHQFVGDSQFVMGNIEDDEMDEAVIAKFAGNRLADKRTCLICWARNFCGGGCHANAYHVNNDMNVPDAVSCTMHRKRIEGAIYFEVIKNLHGIAG